ncbi:hypothetical protein PBY51_001983 [Eleginops maclovinus]|uniref:Death domain-containing protein n=1 Tax=Eleginops maclovinus TaxID=56733 RepID=A0AAN8ADD2_ELEMC|nr:hypothetical protein PBY51_001983 [Eleginops maclovinus]
MKEDLIRMTAILQTDTQTAAKTVQTSQTGTPQETKLEDEEAFTLVEKVKEDLVKVSRLLQKDIKTESMANAGKERTSEDEWEEFSKDEIEEAQSCALSDYDSPFEQNTLLLKPQSISSKDLELSKVVDYLTNDIGASSLSRMAELKSRHEEEAKREGEEKQKRVLKPSMSIQEHKLKMPPPVSGMLRSPSEKDLSKLAESSYQGIDTILESPEDLSHDQDKSPLSDSGFETRSEKTPSAPQSAESTGPKPLFTDSPIPPCVTETRTEAVQMRGFEQLDDPCGPIFTEEAACAFPSLEPDAASMNSMKALQMKIPEDNKSDHGIKELTDYDEAQQEEEELTVEESLPSFLDTSRVNTPVSQEEDSRPNSAQLVADDSYKALKLLSQNSIEYCDDELSEIRGESYRFAEKMLLSEKLDTSSLSHSDTEDSAILTDKKRHQVSEESGSRGTESHQHGIPKREFASKSSKDGSPISGKFVQRDEPSQFDKVTVLHYSTEQGSPKHAVWMRFTEDKHDRSRDKLLYEDRVDQTVKEAEEKLSEVGRQAEREAKGALYTVKQKSNLALSPISPDDDTLEQVSFIDSSGKSPITPETPSSEEVSYDLTTKTPDGFMGFMPGQPSPIMEVSEESEEDNQSKVVFSFKEALPESKTSSYSTQADLANANEQETKDNDNQQELVDNFNRQETEANGRYNQMTEHEHQQVSKDKGIAYIEFPPPPPLDSASEISDGERKGSCASSETETEMMEVNLQEEHDKHLLTEPIIRIQPPSPVSPEEDDSQSNDKDDDGSIFQPIPCRKLGFKDPEDEENRKEREKASISKKHDKNGNKEPNGGTNGSNGSNGKGEDYEYEHEQNGNDQSITDCSIATTAEFSHDTDATEIDSLDGYELQDEDDGLCEQADLRLFGLPDSRRDVWATDTFRSTDRSFPPTKLEVIEEEKTPEECQKDTFKNDTPSNGGILDGVGKDGVKSQEQNKSDKEGFSDTYFSYKLEEEFNSPFKTVATKGLDFDPWPSKGGEEEIVDMGGTKGSNGEPKPFGLAVDDQSQATTPDTTPARTPTDDSTPTSEPNPFPFHEGKMFEMTRSGAIDMSKRDMVEERLQFFQIGPQSPCERTDLRMAIVADHLGLSWTELAREMDFSVDEINFIRVENPNSLTAQSFMLLKKWVHRDGKNATTDALTAVLTKINRLDIVTLLEGPIFDYGNISGTRCFADDNAVFPDQSDGYDNIELELQTPTELNYQPPTPLRSDDFFSEGDASADSPSKITLTRPSDLSLTQTTSTSSSDPPTVAPGPASSAAQPPIVGAEDTALTTGEREMSKDEKTRLVYYDRPDNDRRAVEQSGKGTEGRAEPLEIELMAGERCVLESQGEDVASETPPGNERHEEEEEEEMTPERLQSLLDDIKQEGGSEDEEMTEERMNAILEQLHQAEKDVCSVPGWRNETSGATLESAASGHSPGTEEGSPDSLADSLEQPPAKAVRQNGGHIDAAREGKENQAKRKGSQEDSSTAGPSGGREEGGEKSQHKVQGIVIDESGSDGETTVTTRVFRRRVILKGEDAKNIPGESVTQEQFTDEDGNLVTRKVIRKVVRRVYNTERRESEGDIISDEGAGVGAGAGDACDGGGVAPGVADPASSTGSKGGKNKKRGKRSRHGNKAEKSGEKTEPGDSANKKQGKKSQS